MKFKNSIDGEIFKDFTEVTSEDEVGGTKASGGSTENNMLNSFITVKEEALMRKTLVFKASGKEEDDEKKEDGLEQCCHEVMEVIVSTKGEQGTPRQEPALLGSYERTDDDWGHSQEAETKTEEGRCEDGRKNAKEINDEIEEKDERKEGKEINEEIEEEDDRKEGKEVKEENECKYPNHGESQCSPLPVAGPSGIDKESHHICDVSGSDSRMTPINTPHNDHLGDVEQADNFHSNDLLCFAWQIANGMVSSVSEETQLN